MKKTIVIMTNDTNNIKYDRNLLHFYKLQQHFALYF